ncbi:hypothetical protein ACIHCN_10810, partial [Streptomyces rishiriensis]
MRRHLACLAAAATLGGLAAAAPPAAAAATTTSAETATGSATTTSTSVAAAAAAGSASGSGSGSGSGSFNVLSYNVAGLPAIISSASTPRDTSTTAIGQRIAPYDIVHVEEDFNYHSYLYAGDTAHPYRTPTSGGAGIGSGLNTLSKL